jgi:hypothetical protein
VIRISGSATLAIESGTNLNSQENELEADLDNLGEAFQYYVQSSSRKLTNIAQQEIGRMVRWLGSERKITTITPAEVGMYSDEFAKRSSTDSGAIPCIFKINGPNTN